MSDHDPQDITPGNHPRQTSIFRKNRQGTYALFQQHAGNRRKFGVRSRHQHRMADQRLNKIHMDRFSRGNHGTGQIGSVKIGTTQIVFTEIDTGKICPAYIRPFPFQVCIIRQPSSMGSYLLFKRLP